MRRTRLGKPIFESKNSRLFQAELLKVQRRREDREQEKEQREKEQEQLARDRAVAEAVELEKKEDEVRPLKYTMYSLLHTLGNLELL